MSILFLNLYTENSVKLGVRTYSWTPEGVKNMYTKEQQERAIAEFERLGSVQAVINLLGYPSRNTLYRWYEEKLTGKPNYHGSPDKPYKIKQNFINAPSVVI